MSYKIDLTGKVFGRLTVRFFVQRETSRLSFWKCQCSCGMETVCSTADLNRGHSTSCGCFGREKRVESSTTHGLSNIPEYSIWQEMKDRCNNPKNRSYHNYGGRGIGYSKRWEKFENFYEDMGPRPNSKLSLERKNNNKGYGRANCVWDTKKVQAGNTRSNRWIKYAGKKMILSDWATFFGVTVQTLWCNLRKKTIAELYVFYKNKGSIEG